jgi:transcriptional regulator with XRE-family HTH domain
VPIGTYLVKPLLSYCYGMAKSKSDIIGSSVVRLLHEKRVAGGLSMNIVAKRAQLSHSMISRVEHELRRPTLDTLLRMAGAMEIDLWPLIKEAEQSARTGKILT